MAINAMLRWNVETGQLFPAPRTAFPVQRGADEQSPLRAA
jgi:hypothetical protein